VLKLVNLNEVLCGVSSVLPGEYNHFCLHPSHLAVLNISVIHHCGNYAVFVELRTERRGISETPSVLVIICVDGVIRILRVKRKDTTVEDLR
jgi:hypothetical protein